MCYRLRVCTSVCVGSHAALCTLYRFLRFPRACTQRAFLHGDSVLTVTEHVSSRGGGWRGEVRWGLKIPPDTKLVIRKVGHSKSVQEKLVLDQQQKFVDISFSQEKHVLTASEEQNERHIHVET